MNVQSFISLRGLAGILLGAVLASQVGARDARDPPEAQTANAAGQALYRQGLLPSGGALSAQREGGPSLSGADAACGNCHRRSGLGELEGPIRIPPIGGPYLFHPRAANRDELAIPFVDGMRVDVDPYTDAALERAIREGVGMDGRPLNYLMPRYSLSDADMAVLLGYLKGMKPLKAPGVAGSVVNFATIVTPDADPVKQRAMLSVLEQYFADQNAAALAQTPIRRRPEAQISLAKRRWQLQVWTLSGAASTWEDQLRRHLARTPIYAVISGLGGKDWSPVHRFCEASSLPCLFPNLDLPVVAEQDVYSVYYSRGVLLEAALLAQRLTEEKTSAPRRVVQVFREDDVGEQAAGFLRAALTGSGIKTVERAVSKVGARQLDEILRSVKAEEVLVLWLRAADLAAIPNVAVRTDEVFMSGLMGGLEGAPVPSAWRAATHMAYPLELPDKRTITMDYALGWLNRYHIPMLDLRVQVDTYVACIVLQETLNHMPGVFGPDYLIEHLEGMLEHHIVTGFYPRLALAPNERFASKGGYIVHFADPTGLRVLPDTDWRVP